MADNNTNTSSSGQQNSNQQGNAQQGSTQGSGGGHIFAFGMDSNAQDDMANVEKMKQTLESCGNKVSFTQVGPNQETYLPAKAKEINADTCIFACLVAPATIWSFGEAVKAGTLPHTIFAIEGWMARANSLEDVRNTPFAPEHDAGQFMTGSSTSQMESEAKTVGEYVDKNSEYISICYGNTAEELAQNICNGSCGGGSGTSGSVVNSSSGAQIKDKTFEKCIRRICAATDSVFLVENNAAVLFPYTDWLAFTLREKIKTITPDEIDPNVFMMEYNTQGFYNKVTVAWGGEQLPERFPNNPIMHEKYLSQQQNQEQTTQTVTRKPQTTQTITANKDGTKLISEQYDALVKKYGVLEKRVQASAPDLETAQYLTNALLIQYVRDFNNSCQCRAIGNKRYIGGTFYIVTNPFTYEQEMLYLNGYTMRLERNEPISFDLEFKYGPESAENLLDLSDYVGISGSSSASSGSSGIVGGESEDINQLAQQICQGKNSEMDKLQAIHQWLTSNITYDSYTCSHYKEPTKCLQNKGHLNCADTANLSRAIYSAAGLNAEVVHGDYHFWTVVTINGKEYASDAVSHRNEIGRVWTRTAGTGVHYDDGGPYYAKCGKQASC